MEEDFKDDEVKATSKKKDFSSSRTSVEKIAELSRKEDAVDAKFGYPRITDGPERLGWLNSIRPVRNQFT